MKIRFYIVPVILLVFLAACTSTRRVTSAPVTEGDTIVSRVVPPPPDYPGDRLASYYYLEGIRVAGIYDDLPNAMACFTTALEYDPQHAPTYYELSNLFFPVDPVKSLEYSRKAVELEPENIWFKQQLGRLYIVNEEYGLARGVYDQIVRMAPNNPENYRYLAALYEETGSPYAALTVLDSAELRFGFMEELSAYKRQLLINTGMIDRAITEAQALTFNSPYDDSNFVVLGDLYAGTGQDSLALDAYRQALSLNPQSVEALMSLSDFYRAYNDGANFLAVTKQLFDSDLLPLDKKLAFFNDVIKNPQFYQQHYFAVNELVMTLAVKYPGDYEVVRTYAEHQINSGQVEEALKTYKSVLSNQSDIELYKTVIEIEAYLQRNDSVSYYADLALSRFPGNMDLYFTKSIAQYHIKEYWEAISTLEEAIKYAPSDSMKSALYGSMGEIAHRQDSLSSGYVKYYEQALKYDPENLHAIYNYSSYLVDAGKNPEKALKSLKNDSIRSIMLGTIGDLVHQKDSVNGRRNSFPYYEKALVYNPDNIHALNNYSYFLSLENSDLEKALEMIARVMELEPGNSTYIDTYGWILYKLGRYEEAKTALQQAVALDREGSTELLVHYGDILYELNDYFMASVYWKRALDKGYDPAEIEKRMKTIEGK